MDVFVLVDGNDFQLITGKTKTVNNNANHRQSVFRYNAFIAFYFVHKM